MFRAGLLANGLHQENGPSERLRTYGLRATQPRIAVLAFFDASHGRRKSHGPFTVDEVHQALKGTGADLVTVYRCLELFEKQGLIKKCHFGDGVVRYEAQHEDHHHHHVICTQCRSSLPLPDCELPTAFERKVKSLGYTQIHHALEFFGVCAECRAS